MTPQYDDLFRAAVEEWLPGVDWRLLKAQGFQESTLRPQAISNMGARGLMQFMPGTWGQWSVNAGYLGASPHDPEAAIFTGAAYMARLIRGWKSPRPEMDRYCLALASYNAGFGNILKAQRRVGGKLLYHEIVSGLSAITGIDNAAETIGYSEHILTYYHNLVLRG